MNEKTETMVHESGISRRDFIAKTMLVGAGLAVSSFACATPQDRSSNQATSSEQANMPKSTLGQRRKLGTLEVSALGLGCMNMVWAYGPPVDKNHAISVIRAAYDKGVESFGSHLCAYEECRQLFTPPSSRRSPKNL